MKKGFLKNKAYYYTKTFFGEFYEGKWNYGACEKHRIFFSQADYPLKGFHYLLQSLSYIKEKYPDYLKTTVNTYARMDLHSAGMTVDMLAKVMDTSLPVMERWLLCEPYWKACRNTGYIRMHERAARELYGVDEISRDTILRISERFTAKDANPMLTNRGLNYVSVGAAASRSDVLVQSQSVDPGEKVEVGTVIELTYIVNDQSG